ncbi:hypothetical protein PRZ02_03700 [Thermoproteati archaeon 3817-70]|nr:hypothetical protein [TACK group archaeon]
MSPLGDNGSAKTMVADMALVTMISFKKPSLPANQLEKRSTTPVASPPIVMRYPTWATVKWKKTSNMSG